MGPKPVPEHLYPGGGALAAHGPLGSPLPVRGQVPGLDAMSCVVSRRATSILTRAEGSERPS